MKLSYAQRLEDYHLSVAFGDQRSGFYVDIGAGHPVADNVSYWFYLQGWRGLAVEPQEQLIALYRHLRPRDTAICTLVGRAVGEVDFHVVDKWHGLSTMRDEGAQKAAELGIRYVTVRRPVTTLAELFDAQGVSRIDFLKVDVEGAEGEVFAGADWRRWRPRVIVAEMISPGLNRDAWVEWDALLGSHGYRAALFDGLNWFYVAEEEAALLSRFPRTPATWDAVRHLYEFGRAPENPEHPDHVLASKLVTAFLSRLPTLNADQLSSLLAPADTLAIWSDRPELESFCRDCNGTETSLREFIGSDPFRAALGRISAPFDGGLMLDSEDDAN